MKKVLVLCGVVLLLAGCANSVRYGNLLNTWVGKSEENLVKTWGIPSRSYKMADGQKMVEYNNAQNVFAFNTPENYQSPSLAMRLASGEKKSRSACKATFLIDKGIITSWKFFGDDCVSNYKSPVKSNTK